MLHKFATGELQNTVQNTVRQRRCKCIHTRKALVMGALCQGTVG